MLKIIQQKISGAFDGSAADKKLSAENLKLKSALLVGLPSGIKEKGWVQQYHLGAL